MSDENSTADTEGTSQGETSGTAIDPATIDDATPAAPEEPVAKTPDVLLGVATVVLVDEDNPDPFAPRS